MAKNTTIEARYQALLEITNAIAVRDLNMSLPRVLQVIAPVIGATKGVLFLLDREQTPYRRFVVQHDTPLQTQPIAGSAVLERGLAAWCLQNRESALIADVRYDERWLFDETEAEIRSVLAIPCIYQELVFGVMTLVSDQEDCFDTADLTLAEAAAYQIAGLIGGAYFTDELQAQQDQQRSILQHIGEPLVVLNCERRFKLINQDAERLLGQSAERLLGQRLTAVVDRPLWHQLAAGLDTTDLSPGHAILQLRDEETSQDYRVHIVAMDPTDQMCDYVLVFIEETAQQDLQQLKRHMMRIGSHDLKAPLHIALGYINMLQADIAQGQTIEPTWIDEISRAIGKMNKLVDELLSEERLERESRYRREDISLKALIASVVDEFEPMLKARNQSLALEIAADIPTMSGDSHQIREAMAHYLRNAVQYSPHGATITIRATCEEDIFRFEVQDTGIGIPEDLQANLFQPGYRAPRPATEDMPGAGKGLSLVAEICRRHKGKVWFESQENGGSTFGFSLPIGVNE